MDSQPPDIHTVDMDSQPPDMMLSLPIEVHFIIFDFLGMRYIKALLRLYHKQISDNIRKYMVCKIGEMPLIKCERLCGRMTKGGHLNCLKLVFAEIIGKEKEFPFGPWNGNICYLAVRNGDLEILEWAREKGCPWDSYICYYAAAGGYFKILKWARENGCPWNAKTCSCAAENGHLHILEWARANKCPWDANTCAKAAEGGHLHILQWAHENGCDWDTYTCSCAAEGGHLDVLKWAISKECPCSKYTFDFMISQGFYTPEQRKVMKWLRENDLMNETWRIYYDLSSDDY